MWLAFSSPLIFLSLRMNSVCVFSYFHSLPAALDDLSVWLQNVHQGYLTETLERFLKAREWNVSKAHKMVRHDLLIFLKYRSICCAHLDVILSVVSVGRLFKLASGQWNRHDANSKYLICFAPELSACSIGPWVLSVLSIALPIQKPILPVDVYRAVRDSQLIGLSGYSREVCVLHILQVVEIRLWFSKHTFCCIPSRFCQE